MPYLLKLLASFPKNQAFICKTCLQIVLNSVQIHVYTKCSGVYVHKYAIYQLITYTVEPPYNGHFGN